ncbi:hypothetical protein BD310DRAFT_920276 [Dichomitus squalens]|uniref:GDP-fucose protein O-fucosyltransferase-domain-containing protein n=1 Tax=Dichomitus squalens TaxID=114155 RepID=A0A4Q9Q2T9_9APHY|nr:hypothetical protein BD310DRAFT_920276 [Dichomitus squalens]
MHPMNHGYAWGKRPAITQRHTDADVTAQLLSASQERYVKRTRRSRSRSPGTTLRRPYDKEIVILIIVLLVVSIASLYAAGVLFMVAWSRNSTRPRPGSSLLSKDHNLVLPPDSSAGSSGSLPRYLSYLPHSGFHNQRIALENALVLAQLLNRTLLIPPIRLGAPLAYYPFDELYDMVANSTKAGLGHCSSKLQYDSNYPPECEDYQSYTHIPWDWLIDLSNISNWQPLLSGWNFTDAWLQDTLNLLAAEDIFRLKDDSRHQYAFQDFFSLDPPGRKFSESVHIAALLRRPERLIMLGTLFGSSRLHLRSEEHFLFRGRVREQMVFTNAHLVDVAGAIRTALGGSYLAVHLRIGDGSFEVNATNIVRRSWWKLLQVGLEFSDEEILELEEESFPDEDNSEPPIFAPDLPALRSPHPPLLPFPSNATPTSEFPCRGRLHSAPRLRRLNAPLYIATDATSPSLNPLLWRFLRTFPCSFFLEDFAEQTRPLDALRSEVDGVPLGSFLMPFVEAMVAGQAWQVIGTESSTFSAFVTDVLWRRYHGFQIVQRG